MYAQPEWIVGGVLVALALVAVAFVLGRRTAGGARQVRELQSRLEVAAQERERVESELAGYRERVAGHFAETSERLHELTVQYRAVYDHLAKGASELCPESFAKLEGGLGLDSLPEELPRRGASETGETTDLDRAGPWTDARPDPSEEPREEAPTGEAAPREDAEAGAPDEAEARAHTR